MNGEAQRVVEMVRQSGNRLKETLTSVLELARLERQSSERRTKPCDLVEQVEKTLDVMQPQISSNGLDLAVQVGFLRPRHGARTRREWRNHPTVGSFCMRDRSVHAAFSRGPVAQTMVRA